MSQDYDAQDEYSSDSQTPSLSISDLRTSPLRVPSSSQPTTSSASCDSQPHLPTPPQLRRFRAMFEGRDERGNAIPSEQMDESRSPPFVPDDYHDPLDDISASPLPIPEDYIWDDSSSYESSISQSTPSPVRNFYAMFSSDSEPSQSPEDD